MEVGNEPCSTPSLEEVADGVSPTELQENRRSKHIWEGKNLIGFRHTDLRHLWTVLMKMSQTKMKYSGNVTVNWLRMKTLDLKKR